MADPYGLKSQVQSGLSRQFKKFVGGALENISGGGTSLSQVSRLQNNPKRSTEHLEFPLGVANGDPGIGNHGHYIMFYINTQTKAKLRTSGEAGGGSIVDSDREYNIPKFIQEWNSVTQSYEKVKGEAIKAKNVNDALLKASTDPQAIRQGTAPIVSQDVQSKASGSTIRIKRAPTKRLKTGIAMYMPASVSVGTSAQYSEVEIGSLAVAAQHLLNQSDVPNPFDKPAEFGAAMLKKGEEAMGKARGTDAGVSFKEGLVRGILDPIPGLSGIGAVEDIGRGFVRNDRLELSFNGIGRRSFSFSFKCMPKSENEALAVDKIVNMFRFYMAPSFKGDVSLSRTMIVPATFDISYLFETGTPNFFLNRISTCVLESCNVTYGGERVQFYRPTTKLVNGKSMPGAPPVETSIELQFKEIELITRERIGVGY